MNVHCSSRQGKNNPEDNSEINRATLLVSKGDYHLTFEGQIASAQSPGGGVAQSNLGVPLSPGKASGARASPPTPTVGLRDGTSALVSGRSDTRSSSRSSST